MEEDLLTKSIEELLEIKQRRETSVRALREFLETEQAENKRLNAEKEVYEENIGDLIANGKRQVEQAIHERFVKEQERKKPKFVKFVSKMFGGKKTPKKQKPETEVDDMS